MNRLIKWESRNHKSCSVFPSLIGDALMIITGLTMLFGNLSLQSTELVIALIESFCFILIGYIHFVLNTRMYINTQTVIYRITEDFIEFEYGLFRKKCERLHFEDLAKISVLKDENNLYTIILYPTIPFYYKGINCYSREILEQPTIEVNNGFPIVINLIESKLDPTLEYKYEQDLADYNHRKYFQSEISEDQRKWNLFLSVVFIAYVFLFIVNVIDRDLLNAHTLVDVISKVHIDEGYDSIPIFHTYYTKSGEKFAALQSIAAHGDSVVVEMTPLFNNVSNVIVNGFDKRGLILSSMNGVFGWIYLIFTIYLAIAAWRIISLKGRLPFDERGFIYIGPVVVCFLTYGMWNWVN